MKKKRHIKRSIVTTVAVAMLATTPALSQEAYLLQEEHTAVQLRTNGILDILLNPNVGIELQADNGIAWQLDYMGSWWNRDSKNHYFSAYAFQTEIRYYFEWQRAAVPYCGHHIGLYGQMATYDFEFGGKGYQCDRLDNTFAVGVSYGYAFALSRHWNLDLTAGFGYLRSQYDEYSPTVIGYRKEETRRITWWGPTKLEVSLVWNINRKNKKERKQ